MHEKLKLTVKTDELEKVDSYEEQIALERLALDQLIERAKTSPHGFNTYQRSFTKSGQEIRAEAKKYENPMKQKNTSFEELFDPSMQFVQVFVCHYWDSYDHDRKGTSSFTFFRLIDSLIIFNGYLTKASFYSPIQNFYSNALECLL